jgi:[protein-PII] uridylyltransferase
LGSDLDLVLVHDGKQTRRRSPRSPTGSGIRCGTAGSASITACARFPRPSRSPTGPEGGHGAPRRPSRRGRCRTLSAELSTQVRARWRAKAGSRLPELAEAVAERERVNGEVAFLLEPDLKESRGGLRDITAVRALATAWVADPPGGRGAGRRRRAARRARRAAPAHRPRSPAAAGAAGHRRSPRAAGLRRARPQRRRRRPHRRLLLEHRLVPRVAQHQAAPLGRPQGRAPRPGRGGRGARRRGDAGRLRRPGQPIPCWCSGRPARPPSPTSRSTPHTLERLATESAPMPVPWPQEAREAFVGMLAAGRPAVAVSRRSTRPGS